MVDLSGADIATEAVTPPGAGAPSDAVKAPVARHQRAEGGSPVRTAIERHEAVT